MESDEDFVVHNDIVLTKEMKREFGRLVVHELGGEAVNLYRSIECTYTMPTGVKLPFDILFTSTTWGTEVLNIPHNPFHNKPSCRRVVRLLKLLGHHRQHSLRKLSGIYYEWIVLTVWSRMPPTEPNIEVINLFAATFKYIRSAGVLKGLGCEILATDVNACPHVEEVIPGPFVSDGVLEAWGNHAARVLFDLRTSVIQDEEDFEALLGGQKLIRTFTALGR
ncbi:hypothetical protein HDV00_010011 [Rhizophlyctis rosea]|nr:hypothetical protein HDV00_010011 [Rhizophlyctis rosea]